MVLKISRFFKSRPKTRIFRTPVIMEALTRRCHKRVRCINHGVGVWGHLKFTLNAASMVVLRDTRANKSSKIVHHVVNGLFGPSVNKIMKYCCKYNTENRQLLNGRNLNKVAQNCCREKKKIQTFAYTGF